MAFHLRVYDNFHSYDESEADDIGSFATYSEALDEAKAIIDEFLVTNWKKGISPEALLCLFDDFGNDPVVISDVHEKHECFSGRSYAVSRVDEICRKLELQEMDIQKLYREALNFASAKHVEIEQKVPGTNLPYDVHLSNVAMEILIAGFNTPNFNTAFAVQVALLHDTIEDTETSFPELEKRFGIEIAEAVSALSKNNKLPKDQQMHDSLNRIKEQSREVWAVKLADRITNLQPPHHHWDFEKKTKYRDEAVIILRELQKSNEYLAARLKAKIEEYGNYINSLPVTKLPKQK